MVINSVVNRGNGAESRRKGEKTKWKNVGTYKAGASSFQVSTSWYLTFKSDA